VKGAFADDKKKVGGGIGGIEAPLQRDSADQVFRETASSRRIRRSLSPFERLRPENGRYRRLTWKRRPWPELEDQDLSAKTSSFPGSGSVIYLVSDIDKNSLQQSDADKKACSDSSPSANTPFQDADNSAAARGSHNFVDNSSDDDDDDDGDVGSQPRKRVDRSLSLSTSDLLASAGQSIARNVMKRRRGGRMYDVPQIGESQSTPCKARHTLLLNINMNEERRGDSSWRPLECPLQN
jgi:hypothetical protein